MSTFDKVSGRLNCVSADGPSATLWLNPTFGDMSRLTTSELEPDQSRITYLASTDPARRGGWSLKTLEHLEFGVQFAAESPGLLHSKRVRHTNTL